MASRASSETDSAGFDSAVAAVKRDGPIPWGQMDPILRMGGYFAFPLPENLDAAMRKMDALFDLALDNDPRELDKPPTIRTLWGDVPVGVSQRYKMLEKLAQKPNDEKAVNLRRAAVALERHVRTIDLGWDRRRHEVWAALRDAELLASERLYHYLMANLAVVRAERARYQANPDFAELWKSARRVYEARKVARVGALKREAFVVDLVAALLVLDAIGGSIGRNELLMDPQAQKEIADAAELSSVKSIEVLEGVTAYLKAVRQEAATFPVLLIMDHSVGHTVADFMTNVFEALDKAEGAIANLCRTGVNSETVPDSRVANLSDMAERIAAGSIVTVWKLPFFIDHALNDMSMRDANIVRRMRRFAGEVERGDSIQAGIMLGGVDVAMMGAALAGPVGVGVAFIWAVTALARSVHEYTQLQDLFEASISPEVLLLGVEHETASKLGVVFDILGLLV